MSAALVHTPRPDGRPIGFQRWRDLLFVHWTVPETQLRALVPSGLALDLWQGQALVGLVPFTMRDVSPWWSPSVPGVSNFHELNLRTYVTAPGDPEPGVWFFSLDAAKLLAVLVARIGWALPYHWSSMALKVDGASLTYRSRRRWPGPRGTSLDCGYTLGAELPPAAPGSLEHFLVERYVLYARGPAGALRRGRVHHRPYPLREARLASLTEDVRAAAGLHAPGEPWHVVASPGVDVDIYPLQRLAQPAA